MRRCVAFSSQAVPRVILIVLAALSAPAQADVYAYADIHGVAHYTNAPDNSAPGRGLYQRISSLLVESGKDNRAHAPVVRDNVSAYAQYIEQVANEIGVDAALVHAVITAESGYNPNAVSRAGAQGLMQLMPATAKRYAVRDILDPHQNIRGGTRYLRDLLDMFDNNLELAIAAYNAGENAVIRYGMKIPPYRETQAYVPKVLRLHVKYAALMK